MHSIKKCYLIFLVPLLVLSCDLRLKRGYIYYQLLLYKLDSSPPESLTSTPSLPLDIHEDFSPPEVGPLLPPEWIPAPGHFTTLSNVSLMVNLPPASIYFTTDGSIPTTSSTLYTEPIGNVWSLAGKLLRAFAVKSGFPDTSVVDAVYSYPHPKTGQTSCWDSSGNPISCTGTGMDGDSQKGVGKGFIDNGDGTITDQFTGLVWQKCTRGQNNDTSCTGTATTHDWSDSSTYCSNLTLAGRTWRLPYIQELLMIVDYGTTSYIDAIFPNLASTSKRLWSSTQVPNNTLNALTMSLTNGALAGALKTNTSLYNTRCVSGFPKGYVGSYTDLGDGTVRDNSTTLLWQKCSKGQTSPSCTGTLDEDNWNAALSYCANLNLAGRSWRLPNVYEFYLLTDTSKTSTPFLDSSAFPNHGDMYWTSTTQTHSPSHSLVIVFHQLRISFANKTTTTNLRTRCVSDPP